MKQLKYPHLFINSSKNNEPQINVIFLIFSTSVGVLREYIFTIKYFMELKRVSGFFAQKQVKTITQRLRLSDREKSIRSKKKPVIVAMHVAI